MTDADPRGEMLDRVEAFLTGSHRRRVVEELMAKGPEEGLTRLRRAMKAHAFGAGDERFDFQRNVRKLDRKTRQEGFRVLHSWDHNEHRFREDITPVLMIDYFTRERDELGLSPLATADATATAVAILLDYYLLHLLALGAMRAWDDGDPDAALDRITKLVAALHGDGGSGHRFLSDAESLMIYALSQFHPEEQAYDRFIERTRSLRPERRVRFALASAAVLSGHLRWGFWLMYGRDALRMRNDNVGDYPWLIESVAVLLREFERGAASEDGAEAGDARYRVIDGLLLALAADPWAFTAKVPAVLSDFSGLHDEIRDGLRRSGAALLDAFEAHAPTRDGYSPLALHFNFPHNAVVATVALALLEALPSPLPLDVLYSTPRPEEAEAFERFARRLMAYSNGRAERLGARGAMLVAYDPLSAMRSYSMTVDSLKRSLGAE